jgi:3-oxo-5-alpha-steroid 4-dehydrogenase 1
MIFQFISYSSFQLMIYAWIALAVIVFFVLGHIKAPYGRHFSEKWGPTISNRWGWLIMEMPVLLMLSGVLLPFFHSLGSPSWVMLGLFGIHYLNRALIFPFRLRTKGKKMPWLIVGSGVFFNLVNGFFLGYYFAHYARYGSSWFANTRFILGIIIFFIGIFVNWKSDGMLIHLRKTDDIRYVIPKNWLFEYISCPNLFGELIEWLGFALLCWNLPAFGFFCWTIANLVPRALAHHNWYKQEFSDYPVRRFAIIPYIL